MSEKKNPALIAAIVNVAPGIINSVVNIFKDKKKSKEGAKLIPAIVTGAEEIVKAKAEEVAAGVELSSKSVAGYGIGGVLIMYAISNPESPTFVYVIGCGTLLVCVTTIAKVIEGRRE